MNSPASLARIAAALLLATAAFAFAGCSPAARLNGQWQVDSSKLQADMGAAKDNPLAAMAAGFMQMIKLDLEFKADGKCSVGASMLGQSKTVAGTWRYVKTEGDTLVITVTMDDKPGEQEVRVKFIDDDHMEMVPPVSAQGEGVQSFPFVRVKT